MEWEVLAALRFFLAWIVLCAHLTLFVPTHEFLTKFSHFSALSAVICFLVISGYSIANSITKKYKGFYKRRILRLYPLYVVSILVSLVPFYLKGSTIELLNASLKAPSQLTTIGNLLFLQGFFLQPIESNGVVWTLSIEVVCYLLAPILGKSGNKILISLMALSALFFAIVYPYTKLPYYATLSWGLGFISLSWAWFLGFFYYRSKEKIYSSAILVSLGCLVLDLNGLHKEKLSMTTYILSCLILIFSPYIRLPKIFAHVFRYVGNISYPLYLLHMPSLVFAYVILGLRNQFMLASFSLIISVVSYHIFDVYSRNRIKA